MRGGKIEEESREKEEKGARNDVREEPWLHPQSPMNEESRERECGKCGVE